MRRSLFKLALMALAAVVIFGAPHANGADPAVTKYKAIGKVKVVNTLEQRALNPQPLPPRYYPPRSFLGKYDRVFLNPQPLPPRWNPLILNMRVR